MKPVSILCCYIAFCISVHSQNVGIGVTSPLEKLHIDSGGIKIGNLQWASSIHDRFLKFGDGEFVRLGEADNDDNLLFNAKSFIFMPSAAYDGNVGIGIATPTSKLQVNGECAVTGFKVLSFTDTKDFLRVSNSSGQIGTVKGFNGLGLNYIIAICGVYPSQGSGCVTYTQQILGEIRLFAGNFAPTGWAFCNGQILPINTNTALFALLGTQYGGNGTTNFALPDLRAAVPVGFGTNGITWTQGERTN